MAEMLPHALQLRDVKYGEKTSADRRRATAALLLAADRVAEALDLYLILGDEEGIAGVRRRAVEEGRPVWLLMIERSERAIGPDEWKRAGAAALAAGRTREAWRCYAEARDEEALERIKPDLPGYELWTPAGKEG